MGDKILLQDFSCSFSSGGNRYCFINPNDSTQCIKIPRPERLPELKRREQKGLARFKPVDAFDENKQEFKTIKKIEETIGPNVFKLISRCYGLVETDLGLGLASELIRDYDGKISITLKQYVWEKGFTSELKEVLEKFKSYWQCCGVPSRNLLLHNIVVQESEKGIARLVVIDGLGWSEFFQVGSLFPIINKAKAKRKASRIEGMITELIEIKNARGEWGYHGWLNESKR